MQFSKVLVLAALLAAGASQATMAAQLTYKPVNPSFGGDPLNGNWLLAYGQAQNRGASANNGFSIDFPDFGNLDPDEDEPTPLPDTGDE